MLLSLSIGYPAAGIAATVAVAIWLTSRRSGPASATQPDSDPAVPAQVWRRWRTSIRRTGTIAAAVPARCWVNTIALAAANWLADLLCFEAAIHAVGIHVSFQTATAGYLAAQLARQIPLTPGGIGVIEVSLIIALTTGGAPQIAATAAVICYRVLSSWLIVPVGMACLLRRTDKHPRHTLAPAIQTQPVHAAC